MTSESCLPVYLQAVFPYHFFHTLLSSKHRVENGGFIRLLRSAHIQFSWDHSARQDKLQHTWN
jgi:hypothetical protein